MCPFAFLCYQQNQTYKNGNNSVFKQHLAACQWGALYLRQFTPLNYMATNQDGHFPLKAMLALGPAIPCWNGNRYDSKPDLNCRFLRTMIKGAHFTTICGVGDVLMHNAHTTHHESSSQPCIHNTICNTLSTIISIQISHLHKSRKTLQVKQLV